MWGNTVDERSEDSGVLHRSLWYVQNPRPLGAFFFFFDEKVFSEGRCVYRLVDEEKYGGSLNGDENDESTVCVLDDAIADHKK